MKRKATLKRELHLKMLNRLTTKCKGCREMMVLGLLLCNMGCDEDSKQESINGLPNNTHENLRVERLAKEENIKPFYEALKLGDLKVCSSFLYSQVPDASSVFFPRSFLERCLGAEEWTYLSRVGVVVESKSMGPTLLTVVHSTYIQPAEPYLKHFRPGNWVNLNRVDAWVKIGDEWKVIPQELLEGRLLLDFDELTKVSDFRLWEKGDLEKLLEDLKRTQLESAAGGF